MSVCDKFELLGDVQAPMMIWVLFSLFLDSLLVTWLLLAVLSDYFGQLVTSTFLLCKFRGLLGSIPVSFPVMRRWKCLGMKISFYSQVTQLPGTGWELSKRKRTWSRNAKSRKGLFHFKAEKGNKFEYCDNLWKQNIFHYPVRKLKACLENNSHAVCMEIFMFGRYFRSAFFLAYRRFICS